MIGSIETVLDNYVAATSERIRMWSSGSVRRPLRQFERPDQWWLVQHTLWDQHIFGTEEDYKCPCGRFNGMEYSGAICPVCNVKVTLRRSRQFRFGHINLPVLIPHPFFAEAEPLDVVPVVPAIHWETLAGKPLADAYEEIAHLAMGMPAVEDLSGAYGVVLVHLEHLYEQTPDFDVETAERLARGMALAPKPEEIEYDESEDSGELRLLDE